MSTVPPPEQPGDQPSLSDEQLEAFLRDAAEGGRADAPKEPSARARMVTQRLREQDEAALRSRRRRWGRKPAAPAEPPGWRTGPAWQEMNGTRARRRRVWSAVGVVLAVAVTVVAVRPSVLLDRLPGGASKAAAEPSVLPAETALPTAPPGTADGAGLPATVDRPFRGSPAEAWAEGADAIEVPTAKAVGGMSKDDVALALRRTKEFLVATNLDPKVLHGGRPTEAMALLDPQQPDVLPYLKRALRAPSREDDPVFLVSRFDADQVRLAGDAVKVRGHMTFEGGKPGQVRVHADYTFVYPLVRPDDGAGTVARTIVRRELTLTLADPARWIATAGKPAIERYDVDTFNNECGVHDGYLHPVFPGNRPTGAPATGAAKDPYDRSESLAGQELEECGAVTRT
ncbi:hypothetical protein [Streptomyces sp. CC219B]|uniref:hypothetical protein n=1 Tax=Streptomyces sp. CC219B TaxID=3044574 RepID=UPI0024A94D1B|nr:hypothetical protein [Streptomyces sp. CC219B]